jgi:iron complex outermembrane receptor protein
LRISGYPIRYIAAACGSTLATLVASGVFTPAAAQSAAESTFVLGTLEVIGKREAVATAPTTDTVDLATLAARHRDDLSEALDLIPGISVQNTGQRRERLISLRGFTSRQVPLFIDGVPVYVPYDGNVDLARFGVDYVSEIVVGKGLASLLYGPNILGGAINVVSRKPTQPFEAFARIASEADDRFNSSDQRVSASLGGTSGQWYGTVTASYSDSDGYRLPDDFAPVAAENGGDRENATSHDSVISAKIGFAPNDDNEFALTYYRQDGEKRDPPYAGNYLRTNTRR